MKAAIDRQACLRCGLCVSLCPVVFSMLEGEAAQATTEAVPEDCMASVQAAADSCPTSAIQLQP